MKYYYMSLDKKAFYCLKEPAFEGDQSKVQLSEEEWRKQLDANKHRKQAE